MAHRSVHNTSLRIAAAVLVMLVTASGLFAEEDNAKAQVLEEHSRLLQQHGIATDTPSLIAFLQSLLPSAKREAEIASLIAQLGDGEFTVREAAAKRLAALGQQVRAALTAAQSSSDAEVAWRAEMLLREIDSGDASQQSRELLHAALVLLKERRSPVAVEPLVDVLSICDESHLEDAACEALWASIDRSHAALLRSACKRDSASIVAAAIVALDVAQGGEATAEIEPYLSSDDPQLQLAAARALIDRQPQATARVLADLSQSPQTAVALQAEGLLAAQTGKLLGEVDWIKWRDAELPSAKLATLGLARLDLTLGRMFLRETFASGVGRFEYETTADRALRVEKGAAAIGGADQAECDQRLVISAKRMTGRGEFPDRCELQVRLEAEENNNFGWHLGVSIGRVKVLLHPGVDGGAFRAETVDAHEYLFSNEGMGFTPVPGVTHTMTIGVKRSGKGATLDVTFVDGSDAKRKFHRVIDVSPEHFGAFDRIGLERSGRAGGAALFDEVSIRLK